MLKAVLGIVGLLLGTLVGLGLAWAGTATLSWNANTEPELTGYRIYYRTSGPYTTSIDVGRATTYTVKGLTEGRTYYFVVTAYNWYGVQSDYSNEVSKTIPDTTGPVISFRTASQTGTNTAVITWQTNEPSTSQVEYGPGAAYGLLSAHDPTLVTSHRVTLTGLAPSTIYHFRVRSQDALGNLTVTGDGTWAQTSVDSTLGTADLSVTMSGAPDPVTAGQRLTYTITVTNKGPNTASEVTLTDALPSGVLLAGATASQGICIGASTVTCSLGNLASGASATVVVSATSSTNGILTNAAGVLSRVTDPNLANNSAKTAVNGGDESRLLNMSSRTKILTSSNALFTGFVVQGTVPKTVLIRARGPSLAESGVAGSIPNPYVELYSGPTKISQNDDWRTTDPLCGAPAIECRNAQAIQNTGLDPCAVATLGCTLEAALVVTLPPGPYTAIVRGVGGGTGVGIVEAIDLERTTASKLVNISSRGLVLTGDSVMIGGFVIGLGNTPKTVLVRVRGPSLAAFGVSGVMANPYVELYSGSTLIAQNNDWQTTDSLCGSPAVACGTATDIQNTGKDPCSVTTTSCTLDSAIYITLPPGPYTAIVRGVGGGTGVGIVEVIDLSP